MAKGDSYAASQLFMGLTPKNGYKASKLYCYKPTDGSGDFTWARNINSYRLNQSGLLELMGNNVPRIDYTNTCPELLIEGERENLLTYSEQFDNAAWTKVNATITANSTIAPNGNTTADTSTSTSSISVMFHSGSSALTTATVSVFVKKGTNKYFGLTLNGTNNFNSRYQGVFNLDTGLLYAENNSTTPLTSRSAKIINIGNGWYRCIITATIATSATPFITLQHSNNIPSLAGDNLDWVNVSNGTMFFWGCQIEEGSYPTSYIPTTTASVTRPQDTNSSDIAFTGDGFSYNLRVRLENTGVIGVPDNIFFISDLAGEIYAGIYVLGNNLTFTFYNIPDLEEYTTALADGVHNIGVSLDCTTGAYEIVIDGVSQFSGTLSIGYSAATDYTTVKLGCLVGSTDSIGLNRIIGLQVYDAVLTQGELIEYTS